MAKKFERSEENTSLHVVLPEDFNQLLLKFFKIYEGSKASLAFSPSLERTHSSEATFTSVGNQVLSRSHLQREAKIKARMKIFSLRSPLSGDHDETLFEESCHGVTSIEREECLGLTLDSDDKTPQRKFSEFKDKVNFGEQSCFESSDQKDLDLFLDMNGVEHVSLQRLKTLVSFSTDLIHGTYGTVNVCKTGEDHVVLKQFKRLTDFAIELSVLLRIKDFPGVQQITGVSFEHLVILSKYAGEDGVMWFNRNNFWNDIEQRHFINDLAKTLKQIHDIGYAHNDIKLDNLCIERSTNSLKVTLIDFGLSAPFGTSLNFTNRVSYMAPEIFCGGISTEQTDVFSVGRLLISLYNHGELMNIYLDLWNWILDSQLEDSQMRPTLGSLIEATNPECQI